MKKEGLSDDLRMLCPHRHTVPVADGKKTPTRIMYEVVMSAYRYHCVFSASFYTNTTTFIRVSSHGRRTLLTLLSTAFFVMRSPSSRYLGHRLSQKTPDVNPRMAFCNTLQNELAARRQFHLLPLHASLHSLQTIVFVSSFSLSFFLTLEYKWVL